MLDNFRFGNIENKGKKAGGEKKRYDMFSYLENQKSQVLNAREKLEGNSDTESDQRYVENWTRNPELQKKLLTAKTYVEKLSIIKREGVLGLDKSRPNPEDFAGQPILFDGTNGITNNVDWKMKTDGEIVSYDSYEKLKARDLPILEQRKKYFNENGGSVFKEYSEVMELIFTDWAHEIFGKGFQVLTSSEFDDVQGGADFIVAKKDEVGNVVCVFPVDVFVGIPVEGVGSDVDFLKKKLFNSLNRIQIGYNSDLHYVEIPDQSQEARKHSSYRFSATNLSSLTLPISQKNLETLAELYYKGEYKLHILETARKTILESFHAQLRIKLKIAERINVARYKDKVTGLRVVEDRKPAVRASLKQLQKSLPPHLIGDARINDNMMRTMSDILKAFDTDVSSDFNREYNILSRFGEAKKNAANANKHARNKKKK